MNALTLAMEERDAGALFVVNHSGGKDSQALLIQVLRLVPAAQILVVHATLGESEWPGALEHAQQQAEAAGCAFLVAEAGKTFLGMVEKRFETRPDVVSWPSSSTRQCTSDLKRGPIQREVRRFAAARRITRIVDCMGMRAAESPARAKKAVWSRNAGQCTKPRRVRRLVELAPGYFLKVWQELGGREWFNWLPIHHWSTAEVLETIREAGQELHPAYALGNERLSCVFCLFGSAGDLRNGALQNPELYAKYVEMERRTGYTLHMSRKSLPELTGVEA